MGLSQALLFLPSLSILGQHFRQRRALAIGIATSVIDSVPPPVSQICHNFPGRLNGRNNLAYHAESTQPGHLVCKLDTSNSSAHSLTLDCRKPCCQIQTSSNKRCCKTKCPKHIRGFSLYGINCLVSIWILPACKGNVVIFYVAHSALIWGYSSLVSGPIFYSIFVSPMIILKSSISNFMPLIKA